MGKKLVSNQTRGIRAINTTVINVDNQQVLVDVPRGPHIEALIIRIGGTINITTLFTSVRSIAPYLFLRRLDWVLNSNVTLDSVAGSQLAQLYVTRPAAPAVTTPSAAAGATSFEATFIVDRALMDMVRPKDSMLKTDVGISNLQLRLQMGALQDMFIIGAGVAAYTNVTCQVSVVDYQESRDAAGNTPQPLYYVKRNGLRAILANAGNGQQVKINTGNRLRMVSMRVLDNTALSFEPNIALCTRVKLQRAGDTRIDVVTTDLLRLNQASYFVQPVTGQVVVDFARTGQLGVRYTEYWPIPSSADTYLLVDTTAGVQLDIATIEGVDMV